MPEEKDKDKDFTFTKDKDFTFDKSKDKSKDRCCNVILILGLGFLLLGFTIVMIDYSPVYVVQEQNQTQYVNVDACCDAGTVVGPPPVDEPEPEPIDECPGTEGCCCQSGWPDCDTAFFECRGWRPPPSQNLNMATCVPNGASALYVPSLASVEPAYCLQSTYP